MKGSVPTFSYPELHVQLVMFVLAVAETEFDGQGVQEELPIVPLYVPAAHGVHAYVPVQMQCRIYRASLALYIRNCICTGQLLLKGVRSQQLIQK
jgi:hypothetical protein